MLRRSTSFVTSPIPKKTAMNRPIADAAAKPEVLDDLDVLAGGELRQQERRGHQDDGEEHQAVREPIANRVPEDSAGDDQQWPS